MDLACWPGCRGVTHTERVVRRPADDGAGSGSDHCAVRTPDPRPRGGDAATAREAGLSGARQDTTWQAADEAAESAGEPATVAGYVKNNVPPPDHQFRRHAHCKGRCR